MNKETPSEDHIEAATDHIAETLVSGEPLELEQQTWDSRDLMDMVSERQMTQITGIFADIAATPDADLDDHSLQLKEIAHDIAQTFAENNAETFIQEQIEQDALDRAVDYLESLEPVERSYRLNGCAPPPKTMK